MTIFTLLATDSTKSMIDAQYVAFNSALSHFSLSFYITFIFGLLLTCFQSFFKETSKEFDNLGKSSSHNNDAAEAKDLEKRWHASLMVRI